MPAGLASFAGLVAGVLSGLFGVGGALVTTPIVRLVLGRPELVAVGTPLAVVVPTALAGLVGHLRQGTVDLRAGLLLGVAGSPFAVAGAFGARAIGGGPVLVATAVILGYVALRMWMGRDTDPNRNPTTAPVTSLRLEQHEKWRLAAVGAVAGAASGLMGLGGGFVMVPALAHWSGYPMARAAGTSLIAIGILAIPGAIAHAALGHVEPAVALALAVGVVPGALIGARLAGLATGQVLRRGFAVFLLVSAVALATNEIGVMLRG